MRGEQLKRIKKRERKKKARRKRSKENLGEGKGRMREMNWIKNEIKYRNNLGYITGERN